MFYTFNPPGKKFGSMFADREFYSSDFHDIFMVTDYHNNLNVLHVIHIYLNCVCAFSFSLLNILLEIIHSISVYIWWIENGTRWLHVNYNVSYSCRCIMYSLVRVAIFISTDLLFSWNQSFIGRSFLTQSLDGVFYVLIALLCTNLHLYFTNMANLTLSWVFCVIEYLE